MPHYTKALLSLIISVLLVITMENNMAQNFETPRPSPNATVSQTVGVTHITIDYSSPGVKNRTIWGELVPFGEVWRTGANEVTSITFDDPVKINDSELPAGTYGIHTIPSETEWEIIFSKDTEVDAGSNYDPEKDALRIKVKPEEAPFVERMTFIFTNTTDNKTTANLWWEKLRVSFDIEVATQELVLAKAANGRRMGLIIFCRDPRFYGPAPFLSEFQSQTPTICRQQTRRRPNSGFGNHAVHRRYPAVVCHLPPF